MKPAKLSPHFLRLFVPARDSLLLAMRVEAEARSRVVAACEAKGLSLTDVDSLSQYEELAKAFGMDVAAQRVNEASRQLAEVVRRGAAVDETAVRMALSVQLVQADETLKP